MHFTKYTKVGFHSEMLLLWAMIMWAWFDMHSEAGIQQAVGGIIALVLVVRHATLATKARDQEDP